MNTESLIKNIHKFESDIEGLNSSLETKANKLFYIATEYGINTSSNDNSQKLQDLVDLCYSKGGGTIYFPIGIYKFRDRTVFNSRKCSIVLKNGVNIIGENTEKTILKMESEDDFTLFFYWNNTTPLKTCSFSSFTVDGYGVSATGYTTNSKAFFMSNVENSVFEKLILQGTKATALGIDHIVNCYINKVTCIDCGRAWTNGGAGGAGIGIGSGWHEFENLIITDCITINSGQYGIFIENQNLFSDASYNSKGHIISNCICRNGRGKGIGIRGDKNVNIVNNVIFGNALDGIYVDNNAEHVLIKGNNITENSGNGIKIDSNMGAIKYNTISENIIIKNALDGIYVTNTSNCRSYGLNIRNNTIDKNIGNGIVFANSGSLPFVETSLIGNLTKNNAIGLKIEPTSTQSVAIIKNNIFVDNCSYSGENFTDNSGFNDLPIIVNSISVSNSNITDGKKINPDGTLADDSVSSCTIGYIDITSLNAINQFIVTRSGITEVSGIRVAQYDTNYTSLSASFPLASVTNNTLTVTKLTGCKYIRISSGLKSGTAGYVITR